MGNRADSYKLAVAAEQNIKEAGYWLNKLSGELTKSNFPYDCKKEAGDARVMKVEKFVFPEALASPVMKLSKGKAVDAKLHMILVTALFILLNKYIYHHDDDCDIMIGSPLLKQPMDCDFINTILVFRNDVSDNASFKELLLQVRETIIGANKNQNYPMERLLDRLNIPQVGNEFPLFDVVVILENLYDKRFVRHLSHNIEFSFLRTGESIEGAVEYNTLLYRQSTIKRITRHFMHVLGQGPANIDIKICRIQLLSEEERRQVLFDFNRTKPDPGTHRTGYKTLHRLFEEQVRRTPDSIAVTGETCLADTQFIASDILSLTYNELDQKANRLACLLAGNGVEHDMIVGLMVGRSIEMIIGIMAILKAGGAYLPIEPGYPGERIRYMLTDSNTSVLVTTSAFAEEAEKLGRWPGERIVLESVNNLPHTSMPDVSTGTSGLAYIIYTSGSTGRPKGVAVEHRNVSAYLYAFYREFDITH
ncbi:MAG: AMP-binding protein [bacterium]|nr:AMP-binding protein [bacterium]